MLIDLKRYSLILIFITVAIQGYAQSSPFSVQDSLKKIAGTEDQRIKAIVYSNTGMHYWRSRADSAMMYLSKAEKIAKENNFIDLLPKIYFFMGNVDCQLSGNYPLGLYHGFEQLKYSALMQYRPKAPGEDVYSRNIYPAYLNIAISYAYLGNKEKAKDYINKIPQDIYIAEKWDEFIKNSNRNNILWDELSIRSFSNFLVRYYITVNDYEKAKLFNIRVREITLKLSAGNQYILAYRVFKAILMTNDKMYDSAVYYYKLAIDGAIEKKDYKFLLESNLGVANAYYKLGVIDSAIFYSKNVIDLSKKSNYTVALLNANILLYKTINFLLHPPLPSPSIVCLFLLLFLYNPVLHWEISCLHC